MPVLFQINVTANSGSHGKIAEDIGLLAIDKGWESYIAYGRYARRSKSHLIKIGSYFSILRHVIYSRFFDIHGLASKTATKKLIKKIQKISPDIIHLHNVHGYYLNYKLLFEFLNKSTIPVVWTLHDCWSFTGHCAYYDFVGCEKWKEQCKCCPSLYSYPKSFGFDNSRYNYSLKNRLFTQKKEIVLVPVSNWLANEVKMSFLNNVPLQLIYNGIDLLKSRPIPMKNVSGKFLILGVANIWEPRKGLDDFIELSKRIDSDSIVILVGLNQKQITTLPKNIKGISKTENLQKLVELYSLADVFVNPTWEDNFPTTNLEAIACGTPVVTYKTGGSPEAIDHKTGIMVDRGNINALLTAINEIKFYGKSYYTKNCVERAKTFFDKNDRYLEYFDLYTSLLNNKK